MLLRRAYVCVDSRTWRTLFSVRRFIVKEEEERTIAAGERRKNRFFKHDRWKETPHAPGFWFAQSLVKTLSISFPISKKTTTHPIFRLFLVYIYFFVFIYFARFARNSLLLAPDTSSCRAYYIYRLLFCEYHIGKKFNWKHEQSKRRHKIAGCRESNSAVRTGNFVLFRQKTFGSFTVNLTELFSPY